MQERVKLLISFLVSMGYIIWNHIYIYNEIDVSYACFKNLTKLTYKLMIYCIEQDKMKKKDISKNYINHFLKGVNCKLYFNT